MTQQQWQPIPGRMPPTQGNWAGPGQGGWSPPAQGHWGPPSGQPWQGPPFPGPPPGQGPWGPPGQPPYPQQGPPPPGQFTRPGPGRSPRKSNPLRHVLGLAAAVAVLAIGGLIVVSLLGDSTSEVAYQNEDYAVPQVDSAPPPLPAAPTTYEEAMPIIEANSLYSQTVARPVRCDVKQVNAQASPNQLQNELNDYMECQLRVWGPPITAAGFAPVRPSVTVYRDQVVSACGTMKGDKAVNAFYCGADQRVFYSTLLTQALPVASQPHVVELILAHEFGHAIQARTGIIETGHLLAANAGSEEESLEWLRRIETQADCFSGMFERSVAESQGLTQGTFVTFERAWREFGDDTSTQAPTPGNHGTGESRQLWGDRGLNSSDIDQCNTFTAPASEVR